MTRFTRCESSPPSRVIVARSAPFATGLRQKRPPEGPIRAKKGTRRAPQGLQKRRGKGGRKVASRQRPPLHLPLPSFTSLPPHTTATSVAILQGQHTHCQPCRDSSGRAMDYERTGSGAARRPQGATTPCLGKAREAHRRDGPAPRHGNRRWPVQVGESTRTR